MGGRLYYEGPQVSIIQKDRTWASTHSGGKIVRRPKVRKKVILDWRHVLMDDDAR